MHTEFARKPNTLKYCKSYIQLGVFSCYTLFLYSSGVTPYFALKHLAKYFLSEKPTIYDTSLIMYCPELRI